MNHFLSPFGKKPSSRGVRRKKSGRKHQQVNLTLMQLEPRLVMAPNVVAPSTTSGAPLGIIAGSLNLSGPLAVSVLDTPTPASTAPFQVTVATSAGTASVGSPAGVTVAGDGTTSLQIQGALSDINAALAGLVYSNSTVSATPATITVTAADGSGSPLTDTKVIHVRVGSSATAPTISTALADLAYTAETAATPVARPTIPLVVTDPQGTSGLVVTTTNDNPSLINGITVAGTTPNFTLAITTKTGITGTAVVTVRVTDSNGNFTTQPFRVTVTPNPYTLAALTLAGRTSSTGPTGYADGTGTSATFTNPRGSIADANGFIYVQDNNLIRRINAITGEVVTLAGATTRTTSVDGVGSAAGITTIGTSGRSCMGISVDNKYLYFLGNAGTNTAVSSLRRLVIDPADPNFGQVTTLIATGLSGQTYGRLVPSADGNFLFLSDYNPGAITRINLQNNTFATFPITYNATSLGTTYALHATGFMQGPNNTALVLSHASIGTPADFMQGYLSLNLSTGVVTRLGTYTGGSTANSASTYNPVTNEILVNLNSQLTVLNATNGAVKYTAPGGGSATTQYLDGTSGTVNPQDALTSFNGDYYTSDWNVNSGGNTAHIRAIRVAPGLFNPGTVTFTEGQPNYFDNAALEKMAVVANGSTSISYTLTSLYGTLDVGSVSGLTGVTGRGSKSLSFAGNEADINAALATLAYTPDTNFINATTAGVQISGAPLETITASATGSNATGTRGTNTATTSVLVRALNNSPRITTQLASQNYVAGTAQVTQPAINFTIADADTALANFGNNATTGARITATSSNPNLFTAASMASAIGGTGAARTLTLKHEAGITGSATITVLISDGTNQNTYTFRVTVTPSPYVLSVDTLAGNADANGGTGYTDATGTAAKFTNPLGAVTDSRGLTYVLDNNIIRSISASGVVTTLAGATTRTTRVDGVGAAAGFATPGSGEYVASAVSPDNNWLYLTNGGWLRRMGINPSDSANYLKVTSLIALTAPTGYSPMVTYGGGLVFSGDGNSIFLAPNTGGGAVKIQRFDLTTSPVTVSNLALDGNPNNTILPAFMTKGPNNTAYIITHPNAAFGSPGYSNKFFSLNLATGALTAMAQNPFVSDTQIVFGGVYNPLTNELLVDNGSVAPRIVDGTTGELKFMLPTSNASNVYANGVGGTFNASDAISTYNGIYYLSQNGYGVGNAKNIRAVKPAPGLYNPGSQVFTEGQANAFSSVDLQKMGVQANGATSITYTLTALYGTVNVSTVAGLTGVSGRGTKSISFTGSEADLNAALATLSYTPDTGFINATTAGVQITGAPLETLSFSATGAASDGTALGGSTATLSVLVKSLNTTPRILTPFVDKTYLMEKAVATEPAISFTIADPDTANTTFVNNGSSGARIFATSTNAALFLPTDMATAVGGTGASRTLTLKHQPGVVGTARIHIVITDGTSTSTYFFNVTVLPTPSYYWGILAGSNIGTTFSGAGYADGTGTTARFNGISAMALSPSGNLLVIDNGNFRIRQITPAGVVTTIAGSGANGASLNSAQSNSATNPLQSVVGGNALAVAANRDIYFTDAWSPSPSNWLARIRVIRWDTATNAYKQTETLSETVPWGSPNDLLVAPDGSGLYLSNGSFIQKFTFSNSTYTVVAGSSGATGTADGTGANATFTSIIGMSFDSNNDIVVNQQNGAIRKVTQQGVVTTINPSLLVTNSMGNAVELSPGVYLRSSDYSALQYSANGDSAIIAGSGTTSGAAVGWDLSATFNGISRIVKGPGGLVYLVNTYSNNIRVGTAGPTLLNPGTQSTTIGTRLAFSSAGLQQLGGLSNGVDGSNNPLPITLTLSAGFGTLDFNSVAPPNGVTVTFATGNRSVTLVGDETAVNAYLLNFGYTPDAGYLNANASGGTLASGAVSPDVLSMSVTTANNTANPVTGSLNLLVKAADNNPRIISALPARTYYVESGVATESAITLTLADGDTAASVFQNNNTTGARITATSDNPNLILPADMATAIAGTGSTRTLTLKHQANITGVANVTITINDGTNQTTSTFTVTVVPTPNYYWGILAGSPAGTAGSANGTGTAATFNAPNGLVRDSQGNLFVTDYNNQVIRKITPQGVVTTFAGTLGSFGFADGTGTAAKFNYPIGLAVDSQDNLYVADQNNNRIRKITPQGVVTTVAGTGTASAVDGAAASATFYWPSGIAVGPMGVLYVGDRNNNSIRKIENGQVTTLAGNGTNGLVDGVGSAARFSAPGWVALTPTGMLLVRDINNTGAVRQVDPTSGAVTTLYSATANTWGGLGVDASGLVYAAQAANIISLISSFDSTALMGNGTASSVLGINTAATSADTRQMAFAPDGTIYFTSFSQNNIRVGTPYPSLMNPGAQSTNESTRLAFNSASLSQLGAIPNGVDVNGNPLPITLTLSAQFGTLDLNNVAAPNGVTATFAPGNRSVTLVGSASAINTYLLNFGYTPDTGYMNAKADGTALASGAVSPDVLSMRVTTANNVNAPVTGSLNLVVRAANNSPRIISALPARTYYAEPGIATESAITLTLADADTAATSFANNNTTGARITATSTNPNLILPADMATAIAGTGNARTLTLKHQANITGTATVTITINDGTHQNTYTFTVTVVPTPNYYWGILAGSPASTAGTTNGTGTAALFSNPVGMVRDSQGNLYVADYSGNQIRKVTPQGVVTTFAGSTSGSAGYVDAQGTAARFYSPSHLAMDASGNLYVTEGSIGAHNNPSNNRIRRIDPAGNVTTFAGSGAYVGADGPLLTASFYNPNGIVIAPDGTMYVSELNSYAIRKIANGQVTTIAGLLNSPGNVDGVGTAARFNNCFGLALLPDGNLLVNDVPNNRLALVNTATGQVTTIGTTPGYYKPVVDPQGNWYLPDAAKMTLVSSFDRTTLVGTGTAGNVLGVNTSASIAQNQGQMSFAPDGTIYLASTSNHNLRVGTPYPSLMNPGAQWTNESTRLAFNSASLSQLGAIPNGLDVNGNPLPITLTLAVGFGTLDLSNVAAPSGVTATFAPGNRSVTLVGSASAINTYLLNFGYTPDAGYMNAKADGTALASGAVSPDVLSMSVTTANNTASPVTGSLNLQVRATDNKPRILTALPARTYYVEPAVAGESAISFTIGDADTAATAFQNNATTGARITATSDNQNLIVAADMATSIGGSGTARTITLKHQGNITGVANVTILINDGTNQNTYTFKVTVVPTPNYYWGILAGSPTGTSGSANGTGTSATFNTPVGMVKDSQGNLFVAEYNNHAIRKVTPQGVVTTFAGLPGTAGSTDGTGSAARFYHPAQLAIDSSDNLYVADKFNHKFRKITPAGVVSTLAGTGVQGASDGAALSATFGYPDAIAVTPSGVVYVGDTHYHTIRKIENGQVTTVAGVAGTSGSADGIGSAARFNWPNRLSVMPNGNLLMMDQVNGLIRTVNVTTFEVKTLYTASTNNTATPSIDPAGNLYLPLVPNKLTLASTFDTVDLVGTGTAGSALGVNTAATIGITNGTVFNQDGTIYLADNRHNIRTGTPIASLANPGKQVVVDSQLLTFSNPDKQRLAIQSNGAAEPLSLTLTVTKGTISLSQTTGLTFTAGDGTADATMTFSGTVADINAALNNLVYDFDEVANPSTTSDTLTMSNPWTVGGTSGTTTQVVPLQIVKAPVVSAITNILVALGGTLPTRAFTMVDGDNSPSQVQFTFTSSNTSLLPLSGIVLTPGTGAGSTTAGATGNYSLAFTPTTGRTGTATVTVTATDPSGISSTKTFSVTVAPMPGVPDLIPASDTGSSSTDNTTADNTPTFAVSLGAGFQAGDVVAIYNGNTKIGEAVLTAADILGGSVNVTTSTLADGNYSNITSSVMFGTTRGVTSAALAPQLVVDTSAPVASGAPDLQAASDTGSSSTDNVTNDTTPTFSIPLAGSGAAAGDVVELYNGTTLLGSYTLTSGDISANSASMTLSTLPAGTYSDVKFRLVDGAGNASGFSGSLSPALVIDTAAPLLTALSPADNASNILPPTTLVMTFNENVAKGTLGTIVIKKVSDGSTVETFNVATSGRVMVSGNKVTLTPSAALEYGTGYYVVVDSTALTDLAANAFAGLSQATEWNFTTLSAPTSVDLATASDTGASSTDNFTNLPNISLDVGLGAGTAVGDVVNLYDGLALVGTITVDATMLAANKVTFSLTGQADGVHSYSATLATAGGESAATAALLVTIDTSAPSAPTLGLDPASDTGIPGDGKTKVNTPTLTGTAEPGATVNLFIDGATTAVTVVADANGKWTYTPTTPLADGPHSVVATQTDVAGNTSGNSTPLPFTIDSTPPVPTAFSPADDSTNISPPSAISITFDEPIFRGSFGSITIWDDTTNTSVVIPASSSQISISGNVLTITPTTPFVASTSYHVEIGLGVIRDEQANLFAGISNATEWNFTTNNAPASPAIDLQAASDTGFSSTDNKTNLATLAFDVTVPDGAVAGDVIKVYDGQTLVSTITLSGADVTAGTVVATLTGVTAGSHSYTTTLTRTSDGLVSNPSPAVVVDVNSTQPAAPTIDPLAPTNDNTPTMSGTAPANSKVDLYDANNNLIGSANADSNGNWSFTPTSPLPDGSYQLNAKATDAYGNTSPASSPINLVIDTQAPGKPVITAVGPDNGASLTDKVTSATILTLVGTAEPNSLVTISDNGVVLGTATTNGSGQWTFTTISLNDGSNRFTADATDATGNRSAESDPVTMVIDSSAPTAPVIDPLPSPNGDSTPILSGKGEPGATVTVFDGSNPIGSAVVDANGDWTFTPSSPLSDGPHNFTAEQKDAAGNTSPLSNQVGTVIDSAAPVAPAITPPAGPTNDATPTVTGTAEPNSTVKLYEGTTLLGTVVADGSGNWSFTPSTPLADGAHDLSATATDAAGNTSPVSEKVAFVVDTVAPSSTLLAPANGATDASINDNLVVTFSEPVVLGSTGVIELRLADGTLVESFSVSSNRLSLTGSTLTIDPTDSLAFAAGYYVTIAPGVIEDLAGNDFAGLANATDWAFTTDVLPIPPAPSGIDLQPASDTGRSNADDITSDNTPTLDIALNTSGLFAGDIVHLYADGVEVGTATLTADDIAAGKVSITTSALVDGVLSLTAKVSDVNGTFSSASAALSLTIDTTPPVAPGVPDLVAASDTGASSSDDITSVNTPTFTGTGTPGDTISLFVDGVLTGTGVVDANGHYSITPSSPIADGVHSITSQATDAAGLTGPMSAALSVTVDSTPPATPTSPADLVSASDTGLSSTDNITSDTTPDFSGSGLTPGHTVVLYVDGSPVGTATVDQNGNWTVNASPALIDGSHTVTYLVKDPAGNSSGFAPPMNVVVDTAVPAKPTPLALDPASDTGLSPTDRVTKDATPTINGSGGTPGFQVTLLDGSSNVIGTAIVGSDGKWSITPATPLADGTYAFTAEYTSIAGVTGPASDPLSVVIDTVAPSAPAAPTISPINPSATPGHTNSTSPVFIGGGMTPGSLVELFADGSTTPVGTAIVDAFGNYQVISSTLADGPHTFAVKVTDAAGNTSPASQPTSLVIDSRLPGSPTTPDLTAATDTGRSATDNITSDNTPDFQGVVDATSNALPGDFVEIYSGNTLVGVGTVVLDALTGDLVWKVTVGTAPNGYSQSLGATSLTDGVQAISAAFRTPGGSLSAPSQALTVTVDTSAPTAPSAAPDLIAASDTGTSSTDNLTNDTTPSFSGTGGRPGDTVNLYANGNLIGSGVVGPDGSYTVTPTNPLADGTYNFTTNYVDAAGNTSPFSAPLNNVVIDSTPPAVPPVPDLVASSDTGASSADNITSDTTPTFEGFGTPGETIRIYVDGVLAGTATVDANGNWSLTTNSIADGVHAVTAQAVDAAGNASAQSTPLALTIDTTPPDAPVFTTPSGPTDNAQPPISGTGEPGAVIRLYEGSSLIGTAIVNADGSWTITPSSPLADGSHSFTATATDGAGNTSPLSQPINVTIDTVNPLPPAVISVSQDTADPSDKNTSDNALTIIGTGEPGSTVEVVTGGTVVGTAVVGPDGRYSVTTNVLVDGSYPLSIRLVDAAGNESQPTSIGTWTIDTTAPAAPTVDSVSQDTGTPGDRITNDTTLTVSGGPGSAQPGDTITVYDSSSGTPVAIGTATVQPDGSYSVTTSVLADGQYPLSVTATDTAGNQSQPTSIGTWAIDTGAPTAPTVDSVSQDTGIAGDRVTSDTTLTVMGGPGSAEPGATITVYDNSSGAPVAVGTATVQPDGSYSVTTSVLADGQYPLSVTATDTAGNQSPPTSIGTWTIDSSTPAAPTVDSVSQDTGTVGDRVTSDTTLTVTGGPGSADPGSTITVYDNSSGTPVAIGTAIVQPDGSYSVTTSVLADGQYPLSVDLTDQAGNQSQPTSFGTWTIDATAPAAPTVGSVSQDTGNTTDKITSDTTLTVTGGPGSAEPGTTITVYDSSSGTPVAIGTATVQPDGSYSVTTSVLADGQYPLSVTVTDTAGTESQPTSIGTWTIDSGTPAAPTVGSVSQDTGNPTDKITSDTTLTVTGGPGSAEPGTTITVYDNSSGTPVAIGTATVQPDGSYSVTTSVLADGQYPLSVTVTDTAGNQSQPTSIGTWTIDATAPAAPTVGSVSQDTGTVGDRVTSDTTLTVTGGPGSAEPGTTIKVYDNSSGTPVAIGTATVQPDGSYSVTTSVLADGQYPLSVTATDTAGNQSQPTSIGTWTIDSGTPAAPTVGSVSQDTDIPGDRITSDTTLTVAGGPGSAEPGTTITIYDNSSGTPVAVGTATVQPDGSYSVTTSVLADGLHPLAVTVTDRAGNESQPTSIGTWTIIGFPTMAISSVTVNEATQVAIVRVSLSQAATAAIQFTPALVNGPAGGGSGAGTVGTDIATAIEYYNGAAWVSAAGGVTIPVGATGVLLRAAVLNDTLNETSEVVTIGTGPTTNVLNPGGVTGEITIRDFGIGRLFSGANTTGAPEAPGVNGLPLQRDDDRPIAVGSSGEVNEKSAFAMFRVSGQEGQLVSLTLTSGSATLGTDFRNTIEYFDGSAWVSYVPGSYVAIPAAPVVPQVFAAARIVRRSAAPSVMSSPSVQSLPGVLLVRVPIVQDTSYENSESYTLQANTTGNVSAAGTGTILDNGSGGIFLPTNTSGVPDSPGTPGYPASLDNDMPLVVTATEADCEPGPRITVLDPFTGAVRLEFGVFEPTFRGGARVVVGDVDGDGAEEIAIGSGPGRIGEIRVFERDGRELVGYRTQPFGPTYRGGIELAVGDIDGDGDEDLVAVGLLRVGNTKVFRVTPNAADPVENRPFKSFGGFGPNSLGGGSVAVADLNNDGRVEIIRGSGPGMAPLVNVFDVTGAPRIVDSFRPFGTVAGFMGGVSVSTTWFDGNQTPDILVAGGRGASSAVEVYDGTINARVTNGRLDTARLAAFADLPSRSAAVFAAAVDTDGDGIADRVFVTQAEGGSNLGVRVMGLNGQVAQTFSALSRNLRIVASRPKR